MVDGQQRFLPALKVIAITTAPADREVLVNLVDIDFIEDSVDVRVEMTTGIAATD